MKKAMICLLLCLTLILPLQVAAAAETKVEVSDTTVKPGVEVTCTVSIHKASNVRGIAVLPVYDKENFTLVSGSWLLSGIITDFDTEKEIGVIAFTDATAVDAQALTFKLRVKDDAVTGEYTIGSDVVISDAAGKRHELEAVGAKVSIEGGKAPGQGGLEKPETVTRPTQPESTRPTKPEPTRPMQPEPTRPTQPEPTKPTQTEPTKPAQTESENPAESEPAKPLQTEPTKPAEPEPTKNTEVQPAESEPVITIGAIETPENEPDQKWIWGVVIGAAWLVAAVVVIVLKKTKK